MRYEFLMQGSADEPYRVVASKQADELVIVCSCPSGSGNAACKHRLAILRGDTTGIIGNNAADAEKIPDMLTGTKLEDALAVVHDQVLVFEEHKKKLTAVKRKLARVMLGK